nr:DUF2185 domain-containing protein [Pedobacter cryoconitis]
MVVDEKIKPRFMYREKRTRREDSGWRIFTGFESEEYSDDPNNTGIYNPVISKNNFSPSEYTVLRDYLREHDIHSFLRWNDIIPLLQNKSSWKEVTKNKKAQIIKNPLYNY